MNSEPLDELVAALPDGAAFAASLTGPFRRALRVHPLRGRPSGWGELTPLPWSAGGFFHGPDCDPGDRLDHHTGAIYPQDAASQVPVLLLAPRPGETIVDVCAAPGSKSTQIGLLLGDDGLLLCCDASPQRRRVLTENLARQGITCALVTPMPVDMLATRQPGCADGVLVDAPCSGHDLRSAKQVARQASRQLDLLHHASVLTRPGGRIVYSTCTPWRGENEGVVRAFLDTHADWRVERMALNGVDADLDDLGAVRLWPQRHGTEPFFACRLRAPGDDQYPSTSLVGLPPRPVSIPHLPPGLLAWERGATVFIGTPQVGSCALPSEARGLIIGRRTVDGLRYDAWGAQALISRGAPAHTVTHADALRLWAGAAVDALPPAGTFVRTEHGAPLGVITGEGAQARLDMPSRLRRAGLV